MFKNKKKEAARKAAEEKIAGLVERGQRKKPKLQQTYQERCGHCHGREVMRNGKPCRNCGGRGTITRSR